MSRAERLAIRRGQFNFVIGIAVGMILTLLFVADITPR
jgi:hypothetical protein